MWSYDIPHHGVPDLISIAATIGDLDGDGVADVAHIVRPFLIVPPGFVQYDSQVWILSGEDGHVIRQRKRPFPCHIYYMVAAAGDVDHDGIRDYAITSRPQCGSGNQDEIVEVVSGRTDARIYAVTRPASIAWGIDLAGDLDVDADGIPDLVISNCTGMREVVVVSGTGRELCTIRSDARYRYEFHWHCIDKLGDVDGDGADDFVVGVLDAVAGVSGAAVHSGRDGRRILLAMEDQFPQEAVGAHVAGTSDLDGDGKPDFIAASVGHAGERGLAVAFSSVTGRPIRRWWGTAWGSLFGTSLRSGHDLDRDGVQDLVMGRPSLQDVAVYSGRDGTEIARVPIRPASGSQYSMPTEWVDILDPSPRDAFPSLFSNQLLHGRYRFTAYGVELQMDRGRTLMNRPVPDGVHVRGDGCAGTMPTAPRIGLRTTATGARVHLSNVPAGSIGVLMLGSSDQQWGAISLPLQLDAFGLPGCVLRTSIDVTVPTVTGTAGIDRGYGFADIPLPVAAPGQGSVRVFAQWKAFDPQRGGLAVSERLEWWWQP